MKHFGTLIITFIMAIASVFLAYAMSRIFFRVVAPTENELEREKNYESQVGNSLNALQFF